MFDVQVGRRIRELREIENYTREAFSEKVEISAKFLYEIETGKKGFSAETLCRIAKALSVSCDYIMFGEKAENCGSEKIIGTLESMRPAQRCQMHHMLKVLYDICDCV